jgi:Acyl-protein synthetase, LuxE
MSRAALEEELLAWMKSGDWARDEERFERIALALYRFQFEHCKPYSLLCQSVDKTPDRVRAASEVPAVPTGAFKEFDLRCFPAEDTLRTFVTSGTSTDRQGRLHLDRIDLYEASLLASLRHGLLPQDETHPRAGKISCMRFLAASPEEAPNSSLSYMFGSLLRAEGGPRSGFHLRNDELDVQSLRRAIEATRSEGQPILIAGTAFAFVHLIDATEPEGWQLPAGSRVMETGGFKGRSREVPRDVLHAELVQRFAIPAKSLINQYGMTELGSQFYDSTLVDPTGPRRKLAPPWTRVRFVDPVTSHDVEPGETGMILIHDLCNTGSLAAIQTADLGRSVLDASGRPIGFDVIGRAEGAEARGCSIATDIMLEASRGELG